MNKYLRGKALSIAPANVVYDVKTSNPELFPKDTLSTVTIMSTTPDVFSVSVTSSDSVDTEYVAIATGSQFKLDNVLISNVKIKSTNANTVFIYTGMESA